MIKIELIHNEIVLIQLKELMKTDKLFGFTSFVVHEGYGPLKGDFKEDHLGEQQFLTMILLEGDKKANSFIKELNDKIRGNKSLCFTSKVDFQRLGE